MNDELETIRDRIEKRREEREGAELQLVLSSIHGRAAIWRLLGKCAVLHASYVQGDTHHTAFNEGRRNVGIWLLAEMERAMPGSFTKMRDEHELRLAHERLEVSRDASDPQEEP